MEWETKRLLFCLQSATNLQITTVLGAWTSHNLQNYKVKAYGFIFASRCNIPWCYTIISFLGKETHFLRTWIYKNISFPHIPCHFTMFYIMLLDLKFLNHWIKVWSQMKKIRKLINAGISPVFLFPKR